MQVHRQSFLKTSKLSSFLHSSMKLSSCCRSRPMLRSSGRARKSRYLLYALVQSILQWAQQSSSMLVLMNHRNKSRSLRDTGWYFLSAGTHQSESNRKQCSQGSSRVSFSLASSYLSFFYLASLLMLALACASTCQLLIALWLTLSCRGNPISGANVRKYLVLLPKVVYSWITSWFSGVLMTIAVRDPALLLFLDSWLSEQELYSQFRIEKGEMGSFRFCRTVHSFESISLMLSTTKNTFFPSDLSLFASLMVLTASAYTPNEDISLLFWARLLPMENVLYCEAPQAQVCLKSFMLVLRYTPQAQVILLLVKHCMVRKALVVLPLPRGPDKLIKSPTNMSWLAASRGDRVLMRVLLPYCQSELLRNLLCCASLMVAIGLRLISQTLLQLG